MQQLNHLKWEGEKSFCIFFTRDGGAAAFAAASAAAFAAAAAAFAAAFAAAASVSLSKRCW